MITGSLWDEQSGWKNHVQGAIKLLELRGVEQLNSRAGLELFTTVRFQSVGHLFQKGVFWSDMLLAGNQQHLLQDPEQ